MNEDQMSHYGTGCLLIGFFFGVWIGFALQPSAAVAAEAARDGAGVLPGKRGEGRLSGAPAGPVPLSR